MTKEEYIILFEKHLSGIATPEEEDLLLSFNDELDFSKFDDGSKIENQEIIQKRIYSKIEATQKGFSNKKAVYKIWWAAASVLIVASLGLLMLTRQSDKQRLIADSHKAHSQIMPGGNRAILTLANGTTVDLTNVSDGVISKNNKIAVVKKGNGQLVYASEAGTDDEDDQILYNSITTPRGGQYQVVLPDGTQVWLNAASSLKYPIRFAGTERHVELTGEAYFEVAKNKDVSFTISANHVNIKVLGTHFNVMAYADEPSVKTTLLEGSVLLKSKNKQALLVPGQQAEVKLPGEEIEMRSVNTDDAVSWKNGYFTFRKENIPGIMREIARWYDVDIEYHADMSEVAFGGTISRAKSIDELLHKMELTGSVHFKIAGRRVLVSL